MMLYWQTIKRHLRSGILWTVSLSFMVVLFMSMFPAISKQAASFTKLLEALPPEVLNILGLSNDGLTLALEFYAFTLTFTLLVGAIQAMNLGISILSGEIRDHTADFLLVKPITRSQIITSKIFASLTILSVTDLFFIITSKLSLDAISTSEYNLSIFWLLVFSLPLIQLFFFSLGLVISVWLKRVKVPLTISMGIVFGFFIINLVGLTVAEEKIAFISPFAYYTAEKIIRDGSYNLWSLGINLILVLCFTMLTYLIFNRRDIPTI